MSDLFGTPLPVKPYLEQLPATGRDLLARGARATNGQRVDPLTPELQEAVAREALTCGIQAKGSVLTYVLARLRHGLGIGQRPTPPRMPGEHLAFIDRRLDEVLDRLGAGDRKAAA